MTNEEKTPEQEQPITEPLSIFTTEFLALLRDDQNTACGALADALHVLAQARLLHVFMPDVRSEVWVTTDGRVTLSTCVSTVTQNGTVQLNCNETRAAEAAPDMIFTNNVGE